MDTYDFLGTYFPDSSNLDAERIRAMRIALGDLLAAAGQDVDITPNSPFGDLIATPMAVGMAANEEAWNRLLSDLNPQNAAEGEVWNCEFVTRYLRSFGIYDETIQQSWGVVRLQFTSGAERSIDKSTSLVMDSYTFRFFLPWDGPLQLGGAPAAGANFKAYVPSGKDRFVVDLLVVGTPGVAIAAGTSPQFDRDIEGLNSASLISPVYAGASPTQLQELARRVLTNSHTRHPVTRGGAENMIRQRFPDVTAVSAVLSGDSEMLRDSVNPAQVAAGAVDIHVRGKSLLSDAIAIYLPTMQGPTGSGVVCSGFLNLPETPIVIDSITHNGLQVAWDAISVSEDPKLPGVSAAYGKSEKLLLRISADGLTPVSIDGVVKVAFVVNYRFDPALKACQELLNSPDYTTAGLSINLRWFVPFYINDLTVRYARRAGVSFLREQCRSEILASFNGHSLATPAFAAAVSDSLYYAGAHSMTELQLDAVSRYSIADVVWAGSTFVEPTGLASWDALLAECEEIPIHAVASPYTPSFDFADIEGSSFASSGNRSASWILDSANLDVVEMKTI